MNRFALILVALIGLVAATSCGRTDPALARADAVMEQAPDSALAILEAVDTSALRSDRSRPLYGLLLTQARVKCDIPVESDSLIAASARYFADHGPDSLTMRAYFYKGWVNYIFGNHTEAIVPASKARDLAIKLDNHYWRAKSAELISYIYDATFYEEEGAKMSKEAADYYLKAGKILNHRYSLCDLGLSYSNLSLNEQAINLEDSIFRIAMTNPIDSSLAKYALSNKLYIQVTSECFGAAFETIKRLKEMNYKFNIQEKALINSVSLGLKQYIPDSLPHEIAKTSYTSIQDKIENWKFLLQYSKSKNDYKTAQDYTDSLLNLQNQVVKKALKQSVINSLLKESEIETDREHSHAQSLKTIIIIITLSALFILLLIWWGFSYRIKLKNSKLECKMSEVNELTRKFNEQVKECSNLHSQLSIKNETIENQKISLNKEIAVNTVLNTELNESTKNQDVLTQNIESLFRNQWQMLNELCREYFDAPPTKNKISFETRLNRELQHLNSPQSLKKIEDTLNRYLCNVMRRLRAQCPELRDDDIRFIVFSYSGFSPRAICLLLNISLPNYYNRKSRISRRILKSGAENAQEFADRL